jgi:hypothetical protein
VDEQAPATDVVGEPDQAGEDVLEQARPEPVALVVDVDAEPGQQGDRLRVPTGPLA